MKNLWLLGLLLPVTLFAQPKPLHKVSLPERQERLAGDAKAVLVERQGLREVIAYMDAHPELFPTEKPQEPRLLRREEKKIIWETWQRTLDYMVMLDAMDRSHGGFLRLKGTDEEDSFLIGYAAMLAQYRTALEFIQRVERNPDMDTVLNDAIPEMGLPAGMYAKMKFRFLNVVIASEFAARESVKINYPGERQPALRAAIDEDAKAIWRAGAGRGELLTLKNALKVLKRGAGYAWLPIQSGVSEWMGDTKVYRNGRSLISSEQVQSLHKVLQPGDVLVERREWFVSNVGLPGFWSHVALYLGTAEERRAYFGADETVQAWVKQHGEPSGNFEVFLQKCYPANWQQSQILEHGHDVRIIEAMSEGVSLTSLEHTADCDSLAILRPRLPKLEKAMALSRALHYVGRPYDFNFDFATDAELVCTEVVYKAYEPSTGFTGLKLPLTEMLGRLLLPANDIVQQFDAQTAAGEAQFELIRFLDGHEGKRSAVDATPEEFRASWKRPKWHVLTQD